MKPREALQPHSRHKGRKQAERHAGHKIHNSTRMPHQGFLAAANKGPKLSWLLPPVPSSPPLNGILFVSTFLTTLLLVRKAIAEVPWGTWASLDAAWPSLSLKNMHEQVTQSRQSQQNKSLKKSFKINKVEQPTPEETGISWIQETM